MFGIAHYGAFVVPVRVFLAIPGPGNLALLGATAHGGVRSGMAATLGGIPGAETQLGLAPWTDFEPKPEHFLKTAFFITVLNPKAVVFYMAFFPLFVNPAQHQGLTTFAVMAATIAALTLAYGLVIVVSAHLLAKRPNADRIVGFLLNQITALLLLSFALKMALFH